MLLLGECNSSRPSPYKTVPTSTLFGTLLLKEHGIDPGPQRGQGTWDEFLKMHAATLWPCDFFAKKCWTWKRPVDLYLLVFLQVGSRKVWISLSTAHA